MLRVEKPPTDEVSFFSHKRKLSENSFNQGSSKRPTLKVEKRPEDEELSVFPPSKISLPRATAVRTAGQVSCQLPKRQQLPSPFVPVNPFNHGEPVLLGMAPRPLQQPMSNQPSLIPQPKTKLCGVKVGGLNGVNQMSQLWLGHHQKSSNTPVVAESASTNCEGLTSERTPLADITPTMTQEKISPKQENPEEEEQPSSCSLRIPLDSKEDANIVCQEGESATYSNTTSVHSYLTVHNRKDAMDQYANFLEGLLELWQKLRSLVNTKAVCKGGEIKELEEETEESFRCAFEAGYACKKAF